MFTYTKLLCKYNSNFGAGGINMLMIFLGFALLASAITANKMLLATFSPMFFVGIRMLTAGIILSFLYYRNYSFSWKAIKQNWTRLIVAALFTTFFQSILKAYALKYLFSSKAVFIGSLDPFVTALLAYILFNERLSLQKLCGISIGFVGSCYLCTSSSLFETTFASFAIFSLPELAAFAAMVIGRYGWLQAQQLLRRSRFAPIELNGIMMLISGATSLAASFFVENLSYLSCSVVTVNNILLFMYTVVIGNIIAYSMYANFLKNHSASFVSLAGFSVPLFVSFYGWLILGEPITQTLIVAALIILSGVMLFYNKEFRRG